MPGPWVSDAVLYTEFAGLVGKEPSGLPSHWMGLVAEANDRAAVEITQIVVGKGYSITQLDAADNRARWNKSLGFYYAFLSTGAGAAYDAKFVDRFDIRADLRELTVLLADGAGVAPAAPSDTDVGGIAHGTATTARTTILEDAYARGLFGRP